MNNELLKGVTGTNVLGFVPTSRKKAKGLYKLVMNFKGSPNEYQSFEPISYSDSNRTILKFDDYTYEIPCVITVSGFLLQETTTQSTENSYELKAGWGSNYLNEPGFELKQTDDSGVTSCGADPAPDIMQLAGKSSILKGTTSQALRIRFKESGGSFNTVCQRKFGTIEIIFSKPENAEFYIRPNSIINDNLHSVEVIEFK